jgi:inosose dehydratase
MNPIAWSNDDFRDLGGDISLQQCLDEMREAGFAGTELGHKFPNSESELNEVLQSNRLRLVSGWHSTFLATQDFEPELIRFKQHLKLLKACGSDVVIVAECSRCIHSDPNSPLDFAAGFPSLSRSQWSKVYSGLTALIDWSTAEGMRLVYHHHMGTVVQRRDELEKLLQKVPSLSLLYDTGHLSFAGIEPLTILKAYAPRIGHIHLKNVRPQIVRSAQAGGWSFERAVRAGVFTVPGDPEGSVDFPKVFSGLASANYKGWLVIEAEQDPAKAVPLHYARLGRDYIRAETGL